jgi:hypothetical protein
VFYLPEGHSDVLCRSIATQMPRNGFNRWNRLCVSGDFSQ